MKPLLKFFLFSLILCNISCMHLTNKRQERIRKNSPPEEYFQGKDLKLGQAIYNGDLKTIESLVRNDRYNLNQRGNKLPGPSATRPVRYTYLGYAVRIGDVRVAEKLLQMGADPDLINDEGDGGGGFVANINLACDFKNNDMIRLLVRYKENLNPELSGSPLDDLLIGDADKRMIELLLANGANVNHQDYISGDLPIVTALHTGKLEYVEYLLNKGTDPTILDYIGDSFAYTVQKMLEEGRMREHGIKEVTKFKERLATQYHVKFPLKNEYRKGLELSIKRYNSLSVANKTFLGQAEVERMKLFKKWLDQGVTDDGIPLN